MFQLDTSPDVIPYATELVQLDADAAAWLADVAAAVAEFAAFVSDVAAFVALVAAFVSLVAVLVALVAAAVADPAAAVSDAAAADYSHTSSWTCSRTLFRSSKFNLPVRTSCESKVFKLTSWSEQSTPPELSMKSVLSMVP